jgi:hypothetical protein
MSSGGSRRWARWAARPIPIGHPDFALTPLVIGPGSIPVVRDEAEARRAPDLAVLSVILNPDRDDSVALAQTAIAAARTLDDRRATLYPDLVVASLPAAARLALEALMVNGRYEYQSEFAKRYFSQGRAEGRAEDVITVLTARGIAVPDDARAHILACSDLKKLDRWLASAVTASSAADVVGTKKLTRSTRSKALKALRVGAPDRAGAPGGRPRSGARTKSRT